MLPYQHQNKVSKTYRLSPQTLQYLDELQGYLGTRTSTEALEAAVYYTHEKLKDRNCDTCALYEYNCDGCSYYEECRNNFYQHWTGAEK